MKHFTNRNVIYDASEKSQKKKLCVMINSKYIKNDWV